MAYSLIPILWLGLFVKSVPLYSLELHYRRNICGPSTDTLQHGNPKQIKLHGDQIKCTASCIFSWMHLRKQMHMIMVFIVKALGKKFRKSTVHRGWCLLTPVNKSKNNELIITFGTYISGFLGIFIWCLCRDHLCVRRFCNIGLCQQSIHLQECPNSL